jgi:hypothetical protein
MFIKNFISRKLHGGKKATTTSTKDAMSVMESNTLGITVIEESNGDSA